jgi:hypothetical protein
MFAGSTWHRLREAEVDCCGFIAIPEIGTAETQGLAWRTFASKAIIASVLFLDDSWCGLVISIPTGMQDRVSKRTMLFV